MWPAGWRQRASCIFWSPPEAEVSQAGSEPEFRAHSQLGSEKRDEGERWRMVRCAAPGG